ncbi:MAG: hypothetical protein U5M23_09860 [Marinagarivorans sp.]|nr:hypothetical protein [Marinagarivorans sp.]
MTNPLSNADCLAMIGQTYIFKLKTFKDFQQHPGICRVSGVCIHDSNPCRITTQLAIGDNQFLIIYSTVDLGEIYPAKSHSPEAQIIMSNTV